LLLLNSDTVVQKEPSKLGLNFYIHPVQLATATTQGSEKIIDYLGILSPTLINPDGSLQPQGGSRLSLCAIFNQMFFLDDIPLIGKFLPSTQQTGRSQQLNKKQLHNKQREQTNLIRKAWVAGTAMMIVEKKLNRLAI
jgi:hypothetical protein